MIFQDPLSAMHPFYTVGHQIIEAYRVHNDVSARRSRASTRSRCSTGSASPQPDKRVDDYPHQFSGGMRQRAMIAMALVVRPRAADRRRADHRARRDRAGADPRPDPGPAEGVQLRGHHHHPRPRRGRRARRRHPGDVRRPVRRARHGRGRSSTSREHPYTWGLLGSMPRLDRERTERLHPDQGHAAVPDQRARRAAPSTRAAPTRDAQRRRSAATERPELLRRSAAGHCVACHLTPERAQQHLDRTRSAPKL